jgi:hypothetical protein
MSAIYVREQKLMYSFLGVTKGNGPQNEIISLRKQNANTSRKGIL